MRANNSARPPSISIASAPAWLDPGGAARDVCISSRVRWMRNVEGRRFPHFAEDSECAQICKAVVSASGLDPDRVWLRGLGPGERDELVAQSLISPDFPFEKTGRAVMLDRRRTISVMVNEEDHLRVQALTAGWSIDDAISESTKALDLFSSLRFAWSPRFGFLSSSPYNAGSGVRASAMFHLIALANSKRLLKVLRALDTMGVTTRGLYGESSRAIGAFVQVSVANEEFSRLRAAGDVLIEEERLERATFSNDEVASWTDEAIRVAIASRNIGLADSLRVIGWIRWAAALELFGQSIPLHIVEGWRTMLQFRTGQDPAHADRQRAVLLRGMVESIPRFQ